MTSIEDFRREADGFLAAARRAVGDDPAPAVPSCPDWTATELVLHLGFVHRLVAWVIRERLTRPPEAGNLAWLGLTAEHTAWMREMLAERDRDHDRDPVPDQPPTRRPLPSSLVDWFDAGAAELEALFLATPADEPVWTWGASQTAGFWLHMQAIEAAIHRWDAQNAIGDPDPMHTDLAIDAIGHTFDVMVPMRRTIRAAAPGQGERFGFRRTDGPGEWAVRFDGSEVTVGDSAAGCDIVFAGSASDLMLFLWQRIEPSALDIDGDASLTTRYFDLAPPV